MTVYTSHPLEHDLDGLHAYAYLSTPSVPFSDRDLSDLLLAARRANARLGITGKLVVLEDGDHVARFAQWIEGPRLELDACVGRIVADPRHEGLVTRFEGPVRARRFPAWDMVLQAADMREFPAVAATLLHAA